MNILAFVASLIWLITKPDWEPLVSTLLLLAALIGQFISRNMKKETKMTQKGGKKSKNYQAGGEININS